MTNQFERIYIEITNNCNLSCSFCPQNKRKKEFMSLQNFEYIIKQIKPLTKNIYLHLMGEPTLHPKLAEIIEIANQNGLNVNLTTNGTLLKNCKDILLTHKLRKLSISLHSYEANNENISLNEYLSSCIETAKILSEKGVFVEFKLWNKSNKNIIAKNDLNLEIIKNIEKNFDTKILLEQRKTSYTIAKNVFLGLENAFVWSEQNKEFSKDKFCFALRTHFGILVDGKVVPCCLDNNGSLALGNIFKEDINSILSSEKAKKIYDGFSQRIATFDICKHCQFVEKF